MTRQREETPQTERRLVSADELLHARVLTAKERQVLELLGRGMSVKAIAGELDLCLRAIELRRRSMMKKLGVLFVRNPG